MNSKVTIGLAGISFDPAFWGFQQSQYKARTEQLAKVCKELGFKFISVPQTFESADGAVKAAGQLKGKADIVILDIAAYPEGKAAGEFVKNVDMPLVLWSRNETIHSTNIGHNSFCGANFLGSCISLQGRHFRQFYGSPASKDFKTRLKAAGLLIGAAKSAAGSKIGLFGEGIVPKFYDIDISEQNRNILKERWGITFVPVPTNLLIERADSYSQADIDNAKKRFTSQFDKIELSAKAVEKQVRMLLAVTDITKGNDFASIAIRCWPELQTAYGAWPCPIISVLNQTGLPAACEGDPGGALDMLLAAKLQKDASTLVDIIDWDEKGQNFSIWHCGPTASCWADKTGSKVICHDVDGAGADGKPKFGLPGVVDMQFAPAKVTVFRTIGAIDDEFIVQGKLVFLPKRKITGSFGAVAQPTVYGQKVTVEQIRREIFDRRLPHHYTAIRNHIV